MKKILIIDDSSSVRLLTKKILQSKEYEVTEANSVAEGLSAALAYLPDLILLDYEMPDENGTEFLLKRIGTSFVHIPVVMLSGVTDQGFIEEVKNLGAIGTIGKPFTPSQLLMAIASFLS